MHRMEHKEGTMLQCFFSLRLRLVLFDNPWNTFFCMNCINSFFFCMNVSEFLFKPLRKLMALTAFSSNGFHTWAMDVIKRWLLCFEPVALMIHLMPQCPYTGKQWIIILYLPLHYHDFIDIIKVINLPGWRVLVCLVFSCMEAPHLNHLCYLLLHLL